MEINKKEVIDLIYEIAKKKGIFIKDLEKNAGISQGMLSRAKSNGTMPSLESFCLIAEQLGVSVDFLLNSRKKSLSENEKFLISFLDNLISGTVEDKVSWIPDSASSLVYDSNSEINTKHPLITGTQNYSEEAEVWYHTTFYNSRFANCYCALREISYHAELPSSQTSIYVMAVRYTIKGEDNHSENIEDTIEIYIDDKGVIKPICCSYYTNEEVTRKINELYDTISSVSSHISLDESTKSIMEHFINMNKLPF